MIQYHKEDLLKTKCNIIAHGCNAKGKFASGVAKCIAETYPQAKELYLTRFKNFGFKLGEVQSVFINKNKVVLNCITQQHYGYDGKQYVDYEALRSCLIRVRELSSIYNFTVAMPKIGAGLGGGDWNKIEAMINEIFQDKVVNVYTLE